MIGFLITGTIALLLISALVAPLESLGWWAGWLGEHDPLPIEQAPDVTALDEAASDANHYLVYLSGIGAITDESIPSEELDWINALNERIPGTILVADVFPYSVTNLGLTSNRVFARLWRWLEHLRLQNTAEILTFVINIRNLLQVAVSADHRYGPIYNLGVAREIARSLVAHGYRSGSGTPITLLGWSGGGQIALGASSFLIGMLQAPVRIISIGGVMADDPGVLCIEHLYHFYGDKDPVHGLGGKLFPGRWSLMRQSDWNRALARGRITFTSLGPIAHNGPGNYFGTEVITEDGRCGAEITLNAVVNVLARAGLLSTDR